MQYNNLGSTGIKVSAVGLGGHEFHPDSRVAGFGDNKELAVTPGHIFPGFGEENRLQIVKTALEAGINVFDLTIDSEKEAMGRILKEVDVKNEILIQTRPEGMVYTYDPYNQKMADYTLLRAEVVRALKLIQREVIDIYNFAFMADAIEHDPDYLDKIADNIQKLKTEGLIRFASADTFSGPAIYAKQYDKGCFDTTFINCNPLAMATFGDTITKAKNQKMGVLGRILFQKAKVFAIAEKEGYTDKAQVAKALIKWAIIDSGVHTIVMGVSSAAQLTGNLTALEDLNYTPDERMIIDRLCAAAKSE
jgi:aryl-alcohol dehydrogenase-like predicted oxidoreductase